MRVPSRSQFVRALKRVPVPQGRQLEFLRAHFKAPGRALTMRRFAQAVRYNGYRGVNLHYGRLAGQLGDGLGVQAARLWLLVDFVKPKAVTNTEWVLVMHPQFAAALKEVGWV